MYNIMWVSRTEPLQNILRVSNTCLSKENTRYTKDASRFIRCLKIDHPRCNARTYILLKNVPRRYIRIADIFNDASCRTGWWRGEKSETAILGRIKMTINKWCSFFYLFFFHETPFTSIIVHWARDSDLSSKDKTWLFSDGIDFVSSFFPKTAFEQRKPSIAFIATDAISHSKIICIMTQFTAAICME